MDIRFDVASVVDLAYEKMYSGTLIIPLKCLKRSKSVTYISFMP